MTSGHSRDVKAVVGVIFGGTAAWTALSENQQMAVISDYFDILVDTTGTSQIALFHEVPCKEMEQLWCVVLLKLKIRLMNRIINLKIEEMVKTHLEKGTDEKKLLKSLDSEPLQLLEFVRETDLQAVEKAVSWKLLKFTESLPKKEYAKFAKLVAIETNLISNIETQMVSVLPSARLKTFKNKVLTSLSSLKQLDSDNAKDQQNPYEALNEYGNDDYDRLVKKPLSPAEKMKTQVAEKFAGKSNAPAGYDKLGVPEVNPDLVKDDLTFLMTKNETTAGTGTQIKATPAETGSQFKTGTHVKTGTQTKAGTSPGDQPRSDPPNTKPKHPQTSSQQVPTTVKSKKSSLSSVGGKIAQMIITTNSEPSPESYQDKLRKPQPVSPS